MLTGQILQRSAKRFPDKPAIICGGEQLSYQELDCKANQLANALLGLGLKKGAKVAILSRNLPEYGVVFFGVARTGYVLTNISVLYAPEELAYVLEKADVEVLIFDDAFAEKVTAVLSRLPRLKFLIGFGKNPTLPDAQNFEDFISAHSSRGTSCGIVRVGSVLHDLYRRNDRASQGCLVQPSCACGYRSHSDGGRGN